MKIAGVFLALVLVCGAWWFLVREKKANHPGEEKKATLDEVAKPRPSLEEREQPVRLIAGNPFISEYGSETGSTLLDLTALRDVVGDSQLIFKDFDRYHLPGNPGIIAFLQGGNPDRLAWIPPGHSFVNKDGELVDRFGSPVFFHRLSGTRFEYRSAGPDKKLWSEDDVVVE